MESIRVDGLAGLQGLALESATAKSFHIVDLVELRRLDVSLHSAQEVATFERLDEFRSLQGGITRGLRPPDHPDQQLQEFKQASGLRL